MHAWHRGRSHRTRHAGVPTTGACSPASSRRLATGRSTSGGCGPPKTPAASRPHTPSRDAARHARKYVRSCLAQVTDCPLDRSMLDKAMQLLRGIAHTLIDGDILSMKQHPERRTDLETIQTRREQSQFKTFSKAVSRTVRRASSTLRTTGLVLSSSSIWRRYSSSMRYGASAAARSVARRSR